MAEVTPALRHIQNAFAELRVALHDLQFELAAYHSASNFCNVLAAALAAQDLIFPLIHKI